MADELETWGTGTAWKEIQFLLAANEGTVLDIACGSGKVIEILSRFSRLSLSGCDISDFLLQKARDRGLAGDRLRLCDAVQTGYQDKLFDYSYSIGSLEHFTEEGIDGFLREANRITKRVSFHMIPISPHTDEGWVTEGQSFFNNTLEWWLPKFSAVFPDVSVLESSWVGSKSVGYWFICKCDDTQDSSLPLNN